MQVVTNQKFVKSRARLGRFATLLGFAFLAGGFVVTLFFTGSGEENPYVMWIMTASYLGLIAGLMALNVGRFNSSRWGRRPREEEVIEKNLKGLDYKYRLLNYLPNLPVDHLLISPYGLFVIETRPQFGDIVNKGSRWRRKGGIMPILMALSEGGLGNPTRDALQSVAAMKKLLVDELGLDDASKVPIQPAIFFTSHLAKVESVEPAVPVVDAKDLRGFLRSTGTEQRLSPDLYRKLVQALEKGYVEEKEEVKAKG